MWRFKGGAGTLCFTSLELGTHDIQSQHKNQVTGTLRTPATASPIFRATERFQAKTKSTSPYTSPNPKRSLQKRNARKPGDFGDQTKKNDENSHKAGVSTPTRPEIHASMRFLGVFAVGESTRSRVSERCRISLISTVD